MRFLHICLASVLNLRSPDDSELPGTSMDKLTSMLFGDQVWNQALPALIRSATPLFDWQYRQTSASQYHCPLPQTMPSRGLFLCFNEKMP